MSDVGLSGSLTTLGGCSGVSCGSWGSDHGGWEGTACSGPSPESLLGEPGATGGF